MVAVRLDRRVAARVDPSDIVQETLAEAAARLDAYLRDRPIPFYPWLRQLAADRLADAHRRHVRAGRRTVTREEPPALSAESVQALADRLLSPEGGPSTSLRRRERGDWVRAALAALPDRDREVLVVRFLEDLSTADTAAVLGVGESAVKMRLMRALRRLRDQLAGEDRP
jgi:RNA polymerase sigma-70 factor (ECF subfamily)